MHKQARDTEIRNANILHSYGWKRINKLTLERYLVAIQNNKLKIALTRFRHSSLVLMIEKRRHIHSLRNEKLFSHCVYERIRKRTSLSALLCSQKYDELRTKYLSPYFRH